MSDHSDNPRIEIIPPDGDPPNDLFVFLMMAELMAIQVLVERLINEGAL